MATKEERELKKNAARWLFWRENAVCVGDAPLVYVRGDEADRYTDEAIKALEKHRRKNKKLVVEGRKP